MSFSNMATSSTLERITREAEWTSSGQEFRVRDISLAEYGRRQIQLAESRMPGLTACRSEFGASQPLRGTRITGTLHMNAQTAVMIETLIALEASVRWCSSNPFSTDHHAATTVARDSASVFAWKGQTLENYWWSMDRALDWGRENGPHLLVDEGGDAALFIHEGVRMEEEFERSGKFSESACVEQESARMMRQVNRDSIKLNPRGIWIIREATVGVSGHTLALVLEGCINRKF